VLANDLSQPYNATMALRFQQPRKERNVPGEPHLPKVALIKHPDEERATRSQVVWAFLIRTEMSSRSKRKVRTVTRLTGQVQLRKVQWGVSW
jgi:hypothetical protein